MQATRNAFSSLKTHRAISPGDSFPSYIHYYRLCMASSYVRTGRKRGKNAQIHRTPLLQPQDASVNVLNKMTRKPLKRLAVC